MINKLRIENFKAWQDTGEMRIAPLTIFCGNNSSGKSSIAQFLLMLKQTIESYDRLRVLNLGDKDSIIDLGTYADIINEHKINKRLKFEVGFSVDDIEFKNSKSKNKQYGPFNKMDFGAEISFNDIESRIILEKMHYFLQNGSSVRFSFEKKTKKYELHAEGYNLVKRQMRVWDLPQPENFFGFPNEAVAYYQNTGFLPDLSLSVNNLLKSIYYVGPLRENPARQYMYSGEIPQDVGIVGDRAVNAILAAKNRKISKGPNKNAIAFEKLIAEWLVTMQLISSFRIAPIAKGRKEYEVKLKIHKDSTEVLITDVGFGISQVLPVIVQSFYTPANSILLFEQPEIHLHPSVQAYLADVFMEACKSRENGKARNTQIIVESHSEHLIRRIQRRIAEEKVDAKDVAIYFVSQNEGRAELKEMKIDLFGNILNWPDNFFGNDIEDLSAMTNAARNRKRKESHG